MPRSQHLKHIGLFNGGLLGSDEIRFRRPSGGEGGERTALLINLGGVRVGGKGRVVRGCNLHDDSLTANRDQTLLLSVSPIYTTTAGGERWT